MFFERHTPTVEKSISQYTGLLGEKLALEYLLKNGFEAIRFQHCLFMLIEDSEKRQEFCLKQIEAGKRYATRKDVSAESLRRNEEFLKRWKEDLKEEKNAEKNIKEFFGEKKRDFLLFCKAWEEADVPSGKTSSRKIYDLSKPGLEARIVTGRATHFGFDYVAKKDSHIYLVEVKTNNAVLAKYQRKMMIKAKEFGFIPMIVRTKVSIIAKLEDVTTETLRMCASNY